MIDTTSEPGSWARDIPYLPCRAQEFTEAYAIERLNAQLDAGIARQAAKRTGYSLAQGRK